jgi:hypothetical protein
LNVSLITQEQASDRISSRAAEPAAQRAAGITPHGKQKEPARLSGPVLFVSP